MEDVGRVPLHPLEIRGVSRRQVDVLERDVGIARRGREKPGPVRRASERRGHMTDVRVGGTLLECRGGNGEEHGGKGNRRDEQSGPGPCFHLEAS